MNSGHGKDIELPYDENKDYLSDKECLIVSHCFDNDKVVPLKPLVEEYGWTDLLDRYENSVYKE